MKLIAYVKDNGSRQYIERDNYKTKKDFMSDLRGNGYKVSYIHTPEQHEQYIKMLDIAGGRGAKSVRQAKLWAKWGLLN